MVGDRRERNKGCVANGEGLHIEESESGERYGSPYSAVRDFAAGHEPSTLVHFVVTRFGRTPRAVDSTLTQELPLHAPGCEASATYLSNCRCAASSFSTPLIPVDEHMAENGVRKW